ncbi:hypothetical protein [Aquimarina sp. 2304DJ70-9]|uniref:hypothetical protein n=1 Tax=Aquimarina penaris TaxID=3231044 RepID=UPI003463177B
MMKEYNIRRIRNFIYRDIVLLRGAIITALSVVSILMFIVILFSLRKDHLVSPGEFVSIFNKLYIISGILFIFSVLKEINNKTSNHLYVSLPVSSYERITAIWLTTGILYTIVFSFLCFLIGQFAIFIGSIFSETNFHLLPVFSEDFWTSIKFYFFIQPVFLYGAVTFNKNRIGKTILSVLLIVLGLIFFNMMLYGMLNYGYDVFSGEELASEAFSLASKDFSGIEKLLFVGVFVSTMLLATYFKIVEKEV